MSLMLVCVTKFFSFSQQSTLVPSTRPCGLNALLATYIDGTGYWQVCSPSQQLLYPRTYILSILDKMSFKLFRPSLPMSFLLNLRQSRSRVLISQYLYLLIQTRPFHQVISHKLIHIKHLTHLLNLEVTLF